MRYRIVEKASGEVVVMREIILIERRPNGKTWAQWERLPYLFISWDDAEKYINGLRESAKMDQIKREEIIDV